MALFYNEYKHDKLQINFDTKHFELPSLTSTFLQQFDPHVDNTFSTSVMEAAKPFY